MKSPCLDKIENVIVGGAPLSLRQEEILKKAPFEAYATYGMTETASHVALRHIGGRDEDLFIGLPGYSFSTDDRGCLVIENPNMSWRRLVTNDVVELSDNHSFRWLSRPGRRDGCHIRKTCGSVAQISCTQEHYPQEIGIYFDR